MERLDRKLSRITAAEASNAVRHGKVTPLFQPIEALQTGECRGFEALARLYHQDAFVAPAGFLDGLSKDDRLYLFGLMLGESIALLKRGARLLQDLYVSINVEISLLVDDDFVDILRYFLERHDFSGERLVLEILENEEIAHPTQLHANLDAIRGLGLSIALDDVGSAYASLAKIRDLPIDIFKLDRSFSRDLEMHPEDLLFVQSILSLARGLDKKLVVEGIETAEVYDALRIIGVDFGQGYSIAPPMPASAVEPWLMARQTHARSQVPRCLLGAYASVLTVIDTCRCLRRQPLPIAWPPGATDHENCVVGQLFGSRGWHGTSFGRAHEQFHVLLPLYAEDEAAWSEGAERFLSSMAQAIAERPLDLRCEPVAAPVPVASSRVAKSGRTRASKQRATGR